MSTPVTATAPAAAAAPPVAAPVSAAVPTAVPAAAGAPVDAVDLPVLVGDLPEAGCPGFVRLVDIMGDDAAVVAMARLSYGDGTKQVRGTVGLLRYLMRHAHTSPFEGVVLKFHVKCPIYIARQWMRHRTASYNEYSQRYSVAPADPPYIPAALAAQSAGNRQGRAAALPPDANRRLRTLAEVTQSRSRVMYDTMIASGVARETARGVLPVAGWTEFAFVQNLHNLFHFLKLRLDAHAQSEVRAYSRAILELIEPRLPICVRAFRDYQLGAMQLTRLEVDALRAFLTSRQSASIEASPAPSEDTGGAATPSEDTGGAAAPLAPPPIATKNSREQAEWAAKFALLTQE